MGVDTYGEKSVYVGDPKLQVNAPSPVSGTLRPIYNHSAAKDGIAGIYLQGEGMVGSLYDTSYYNGMQQLSHYYRFNELFKDSCYVPADNHSQNIENPTG